MLKKKNSECISLETFVLFLIGSLSRMIWTFDSLLKDYFLNYVELTLSVFLLGYAIYLQQKYVESNYCINDVKLPVFLKLYVLIPVVFVLSLLFNPGDEFFSSQIFVSFGMFSEAIGLLPQLYIIKKSRDSSDLSGLYIVCLGIARFFRLIFWFEMYLIDNQFLSLIIADLIHTLSLSNFIYNTIKNWSGQGLPTNFTELKGNPNKKMF